MEVISYQPAATTTLEKKFERHNLCGARLRNKPGQFCRAPPLRGHTRCRLHVGRPKGSLKREELAARRAGHAAYYAKHRLAKARGKAVRLPGGRKKRWPIARPWRFQLDEAQEAAVLRDMQEHDARTGLVRPPWQPIGCAALPARWAQPGTLLAYLERTFIIYLNDRTVARLTARELAATYELIRKHELAMGAHGSTERLERIAWEIARYKQCRRSNDAVSLEPPQPPASPLDDPELEPLQGVAECLRPKDAFNPMESVNRLRAKIETRRQYLAQLPMSEAMAHSLDFQLDDAQLGRNDHDGAAAQLAVLDRWIASGERAVAMTKAIVAGRDKSWDERSMSPRPPEKRLTIK